MTWSTSIAQYSWDWHDPVDLNIVDFADNKLLLYNAIGLGLTLQLSEQSPYERKMYRPYIYSSYVDVMYEYSRPPKSDVFVGHFRVGRQLRRFLVVGGDMGIYKVSDAQVSTFGIGFQLYFQWYIVNRDNWKLYYDNGVGPNVFLEQFPFGGTQFNFSSTYGLHIALRVPEMAWITIGVKNLHISNAGIKGMDRNPALDGLGLSFGYQFY